MQKRKLKYSRNENFNLLHYVEWDRIVTLTGAQADWGLRYRIYVLTIYFDSEDTLKNCSLILL
jgi:hypothetical protein